METIIAVGVGCHSTGVVPCARPRPHRIRSQFLVAWLVLGMGAGLVLCLAAMRIMTSLRPPPAHSPTPVHWVLFVPTTQQTVLLVAQAVESGAELCISYLDEHEAATLSTAERRAKLQETYLFHCTCERCVT